MNIAAKFGPAFALDSAEAGSVEELKRQAEGCTRCDLYKNATQLVFGEGPDCASATRPMPARIGRRSSTTCARPPVSSPPEETGGRSNMLQCKIFSVPVRFRLNRRPSSGTINSVSRSNDGIM